MESVYKMRSPARTRLLFYLMVILYTLDKRAEGAAASHEEVMNVIQQACPDYIGCETVGTSAPPVTQPSHRNSTNPAHQSCCVRCSCIPVMCDRVNNCCPDLKPPSRHTKTTGERVYPRNCESTSIGLDADVATASKTFRAFGVYMVKTCPADVVNLKCSQPNQTKLDQVIPVTSTSTGITFRNKHCAGCWDIDKSEHAQWTPFITCSDLTIVKADELLFPNSLQSMYDYILKAMKPEMSTCGVDFFPPNSKRIEKELCYKGDMKNFINTCPPGADDKWEEDCFKGDMPYIRQQTNGSVLYYANYFCYLCNGGAVDDEHQCTADSSISTSITLYEDNQHILAMKPDVANASEFMAIWEQTDLTSPAFVSADVSCSNTTTYDLFEEKCREWYCPTFRQAVNGQCVPFVEDVVKATFSIPLKITPDSETMDTFITTNKTLLTFDVLSQMFGNDTQTDTQVVVLSHKEDFSYMYAYVLVSVDDHTQHRSRIFDSQTYGQDMDIMTSDGRVKVNADLSVGVKVELTTFHLSDIVTIDLNEYVTLTSIYRADISVIEKSFQYTTVSRLAFCSQFLLERHEIMDYIDVIDIRVSDTRLNLGEFERASQFDQVRVCVSDFFRNAQSYMDNFKSNAEYSPQAILSVVCNILSMVCLLVTLLTYVIFDELRSIPGKNNMLLALHLLIAQCLYQFGIDQTEYPLLCVVLGVFVHMFWLVAIVWMSACTLHMFRTFVTGQSYRSIRACDAQVVYYGIYCYSVAIAMVCVNIIISVYRSDGEGIGYGGDVCYISDPVMVGWVFALPVGIIIIMNMGFFFAVIYQISASTMRRRGKGRSTDRANTVIYMKLSSLTGVTWVFGYLYIWTNFTPLEYIFIVLNAGQGVLIFISFICTQRITSLYRNLLFGGDSALNDGLCGSCFGTSRKYVSETVVTGKVSITTEYPSKKKKRKRIVDLGTDHMHSKSDSVSEVTPQQFVASQETGGSEENVSEAGNDRTVDPRIDYQLDQFCDQQMSISHIPTVSPHDIPIITETKLET